MPAKSQAQQAFAGAELARLRAGEKTRSGMTAKQLREFAKTKTKNLPSHVGGLSAALMKKGHN